eukprot:1585841-Amphidinium_carterae.1
MWLSLCVLNSNARVMQESQHCSTALVPPSAWPLVHATRAANTSSTRQHWMESHAMSMLQQQRQQRRCTCSLP